jgi:Xaa-Pro aminopeptidase
MRADMHSPAEAVHAYDPAVAIPDLTVRQRSDIRDAWLAERLDTVVPLVMDRAGLDAWVLIAREYNEDPVVRTMLPATWISARRRTILVFTDGGRTRQAVARYAVGSFFEAVWDPDVQPDQWAALAELLAEAAPGTIGVSTSVDFAFGDGLTATEHDAMRAALDPMLVDRIVSAESAAIGWLETRIAAEMEPYDEICGIAHSILRRGFSRDAITPGVTTTTDLVWWYRQAVQDAGWLSWFHPSVSVQRHAAAASNEDFSKRPDDVVIEPGDLIHVDFGIEALGLHTDQQEHAYVLRPGETAPPAGLVTAMANANRVQDLLITEFVEARTGNEILAGALAAATNEGLRPSIYTHPIGFHGHAAGPTIGMWDQQGGVPGPGDYPLYADTAYSIELAATSTVKEWDDQDVRIMLEQDAFFDGESVTYLDGRQTELWLI